MAMTDPLGDMLTRIRNGQQAKKDSVLSPASKLRANVLEVLQRCLLYTSPSPRDRQKSRMPSSA